MRQSSILPVVAGAVFLSFSMTPSVSARTAATGDACSLLTPAQLSSVFNVPFNAGKPLTAAGCQWRQTGKPGDAVAIVDVTTKDAAGYDASRKMSERGGVLITPVSGLGDDAYYAEYSGHRLATLRVKKGGITFSVQVLGSVSPADIEPKEKQLAQMIAAKL